MQEVSQIRLAGLEHAQLAIDGTSLILATILLGKSLFGVSPRVQRTTNLNHLHQASIMPRGLVMLLVTLVYLLIRIFRLQRLNQLRRPHHPLRTS